MKKRDLPKNSRIEVMVSVLIKGESLPLVGISNIAHEDDAPIAFQEAGEAIQRASWEVLDKIWPKE